jgi:parallel beta-helix repeat protein
MRRVLLAVMLLVVAMPCGSWASTVTVDCDSSSPSMDLLWAIENSGPGDTVLVSPCVFTLDPGVPPWVPGWPVTLDWASPTIMSSDGAEVTVLQGDGAIGAFIIEEGAPVRIHGFTFRNLGSVFDKEWDVTFNLAFTDNIVEDCAEGLDVSQTTGGSEVSRNIIRDNGGAGLYVYHNSGLIEDNEIFGNGSGIASPCCENPMVRGNHIHDNNSYGVATAFGGRYEYNLIENNDGAGISAYGVGPRIEHNVIRGNGTGVAVGEQTSITINMNDLYGNDTYEVAVGAPGGGTIDATMNWWGTADPAVIEERIHDSADDPTLLTVVVFDPWCEQPGCDGGTATEPTSWGNIKALYR